MLIDQSDTTEDQPALCSVSLLFVEGLTTGHSWDPPLVLHLMVFENYHSSLLSHIQAPLCLAHLHYWRLDTSRGHFYPFMFWIVHIITTMMKSKICSNLMNLILNGWKPSKNTKWFHPDHSSMFWTCVECILPWVMRIFNISDKPG